jgi:hypothetical protein
MESKRHKNARTTSIPARRAHNELRITSGGKVPAYTKYALGLLDASNAVGERFEELLSCWFMLTCAMLSRGLSHCGVVFSK